MSDPDDKAPQPIVAPDEPPGDRVRTFVSAVAQLAPLGGVISTLVDDVVPTGAERQRKAWEGDISARTNEHTTQLREHEILLQPQETLEGATVALVVALANHCLTGLGGTYYEPADLAQLCPELPEAELADAAYELEGHNLVEIRRFLGGAWHLRLTRPA